jgi:MFS transporter, BCD family, chlorophyll transporter
VTTGPLCLGWSGIFRLGLVQASLGAVVVLMTSTLNRVMVIEYALPASLPGLLVTLHYAVQALRPRFGYGSDAGGRRTPWIIGGMVVLAAGGALAAIAVGLMGESFALGLGLSVLAFLMIGVGVGAAGTSLLALLAARVAPQRRAPAATLVWIMMIFGFVVTTAVVGGLLDPFSPERLVVVVSASCVVALLIAIVAVQGLEGSGVSRTVHPQMPFITALRTVWREAEARQFTVFVFLSMLAYSAQDLILEPFAGAVFGLTLGASTRLASLQHGGVLLGMVLVAVLAPRFTIPLRLWAMSGCLASAVAFIALLCAATFGPPWPLSPSWFALGLANGVFAAAAIAMMMQFAGAGGPGREGMRLGLWGAAQGIAFGLGGLVGATAADVAIWVTGSAAIAYAAVFGLEAALFLFAARLTIGMQQSGVSVHPGLPQEELA